MFLKALVVGFEWGFSHLPWIDCQISLNLVETAEYSPSLSYFGENHRPKKTMSRTLTRGCDRYGHLEPF